MSGEPRPGAPAAGDPVAALEVRLGFSLADRAVALAALTHKSYVNEHREEPGLQDNERLEFLGDAVIDLAVSHRLMARFPDAREGELSKMRAAVVDEQGLCEMARALDLGSLLRLGRGEELTGGRQKASLLADAMEAVIAAVFVQAGLGPVLTIVDRFLGEAFARATAGTLDRDYKTQLQELSQSRLRASPRYRVVGERGPDHSKVFEVEADLRGEVLGRGSGRSKKDAEQAAAKLALGALAARLTAGEGPAGAAEADAGLEAATTGAPAEAPAAAAPALAAPEEPFPTPAQPPAAPPAVAGDAVADDEPLPAVAVPPSPAPPEGGPVDSSAAAPAGNGAAAPRRRRPATTRRAAPGHGPAKPAKRKAARKAKPAQRGKHPRR